MAPMYCWHLLWPRDAFHNEGAMRPPLVSSRSSAFSSLQFVTITLLVIFTLLPAGAVAATQPLTCSTTALRFGSIIIGQSETLPITMTNSGSTNVTVSAVNSNLAAFSVSELSLPLTIEPGNSITFNVAFTPTMAGLQGEAITVTSTQSAKSFCTGALGTGVTSQYLTSNPTSLGFGNVSVGATAMLPMVLTNSGPYFIELSQEQITGAGFSVTGLNLPLFLAPKQSLTFNVLFTPQGAGAITGGVNLTSTGLNIPLTGTGMGAPTGGLTITPAALSYGNVDVGSTGTQTMTMTATGASVTISSASSSNSQFALQGASFPVMIAAGQSASFVVGFTPKGSGALSGSLSFSSTAPSTPSVESASGVGVLAQYSVGLAWSGSTSQNIAGYNIYRAPFANACGAFAKVNSSLNPGTSYTDPTVAAGTTYCYATTAVNSSNEESSYSNQAQVAIP